MDALVEEFGHPTFVPFSVIAARLLFAALLGGAIGFEREWRQRPAGLRTHILICVAAATFGAVFLAAAVGGLCGPVSRGNGTCASTAWVGTYSCAAGGRRPSAASASIFSVPPASGRVVAVRRSPPVL